MKKVFVSIVAALALLSAQGCATAPKGGNEKPGVISQIKQDGFLEWLREWWSQPEKPSSHASNNDRRP